MNNMKTILDKIRHMTRYKYLISDEDSIEIQDFIMKQEKELEFLRFFKSKVEKYFKTDYIPGNENVLENVMTRRIIDQMIKEGPEYYEKAKTNLLDHN